MGNTVVVTEELIVQGATDGCSGWNRRQATALGLGWPLRSGWKARVVGKSITQEAANTFLALKGQKQPIKERRWKPSKRTKVPVELIKKAAALLEYYHEFIRCPSSEPAKAIAEELLSCLKKGRNDPSSRGSETTKSGGIHGRSPA